MSKIKLRAFVFLFVWLPCFAVHQLLAESLPQWDKQDEAANCAEDSLSIPQRPRPTDKRKELAIGGAAPDWRLKTVNGETVALSELRDQVVVLDFWAEWCGPCRKLEPLFDQLVREYQSQPVRFFTVSIWPDRNFNPQAFLQEHKLASTFLIGNDTLADEYGIWGMPTYIVIGPTGKVSYTHMLLSVDADALGKRLRQAIEQALPTSASAAQAQPPTAPPSLVAEVGRTVPASRGGNAQSFQIASKILKETRRILVVLPASYAQSASERRYPVTVVVDGEYLIAPVAAVSDELSRNGQIPESVIVSIENVGGADFMASNNKRVYDLTPPGLSVSGSNLHQGGDLFLDFIEKELLPAVDRQFRTAAPRAFVGVSSGGVLATYVAATRATYCAVVALDAPIHLGNNWLAKKLIARKAAGSTPVRYASLEARFGWPEEEWKTLVAGAPAAWKIYREKLPLEGHETMQMLGAYLGLRQMFSDYSRFSAPEAPTTSILPYYTKVSAALGATVIPPRKLLQNVVQDLLMEGRGAAAREAYNSLVAGYGAPPNSETLLAQITEVERRPPPTETVEGLLATPFPTPEEARGFIGDWIGDVWMSPDEPRTGKLTLRIRVENGQVIGETVRRTESGEERANRVEYFKVTPTGLTYGFMNGMRPRGVALFEGTLRGDTLSGEMRFGGIKFEEKGPPLKFSFKRVAR